MAYLNGKKIDICFATRDLFYDEFWDVFQQNGERTNYSYGFAGRGWTPENFKPKYDIVVTEEATDFCRGALNLNVDLTQLKKADGTPLRFDFSQAKALDGLFYNSAITHIGVVDTRGQASLRHPFYRCEAATIDELILKDDGTQTFSNTFSYNTSLETITIKGVIGQNGFNVSTCTKLTVGSLLSILNALKNYNPANGGVDPAGTTYTVTLGVANLNKLNSNEMAIAVQKGWTLA